MVDFASNERVEILLGYDPVDGCEDLLLGVKVFDEGS